jgi:hypothetical protein
VTRLEPSAKPVTRRGSRTTSAAAKAAPRGAAPTRRSS